MRLYFIVLVSFQSCCISGWPLMLNMNHAVNVALTASVGKVNEQSSSSNLFRMTHRAIDQIILIDYNTFDLILNFGVKQTMCLKPQKGSLNGCVFRSGLFQPEDQCHSYVRVSGDVASLRAVICAGHAISSSSEEMFVW